VIDSTSPDRHEAIGVVLRACEGQLEVLLTSGALPGATLASREPLEAALARAVDVSALAHVEQLETLVLSDCALATAYLGLVPVERAPAGDWRPVGSLPRLAADHAALVLAARTRLRAKLSYTNVGFALAPATFTISELRDLYLAALGHDVSATNLRRILLRRILFDERPGQVLVGRHPGAEWAERRP